MAQNTLHVHLQVTKHRQAIAITLYTNLKLKERYRIGTKQKKSWRSQIYIKLTRAYDDVVETSLEIYLSEMSQFDEKSII